MKKPIEHEQNRFSKAISQLEEEEGFKNILTTATAKNFWAYRNNYLIGHLDRLILIYESVFKILGKNNFNFFSREYLLSNPPASENMDEFGDSFADFLQQRKEIENIPYLHYLAKLDWYWYDQPANRPINLPHGTLAAWQAIKIDESTENLIINEDETESIRIGLFESEIVLIKNPTTKEVI